MQQTLCPFSTHSCPKQRQDAPSPSAQARSTHVHAHSIFCDSSDRPVPKLTGVNAKFSFNEGKHCLSFLSLVLHRKVWNRCPDLQSYGFKGIPLLGVAGPMKAQGLQKRVILDGTNLPLPCYLWLAWYAIIFPIGSWDSLWITYCFHSL